MPWGCLQEFDVESGNRTTWELSSEEISVGRLTQTKADDKLAIKWPKAYISGHHFSIKRSTDGETYEIFDQSSNGTFLNGELIGKGKSSALQNGDIIQLRFKQVDKIILTCVIYSAENNPNETCSASSNANKRKRVEIETTGQVSRSEHVAKGSRGGDSNLASIKMSALEQDNKQQEARIECYIMKLETSARENSNLLRELKVAKDDAQEKRTQLEELQQQCSVQEAHTATVEARARKLEESLQTQKEYGEKLRLQLTISEEKSSQTNELILKVETLSDELKHRQSQYESRSNLCDELALSLDNEKRERESLEVEIENCNTALEQSQQETRELRRCNDGLLEAQRLTKRSLADRQAKIDLLETMARQIQDEESKNIVQFRSQMSSINASLGQLQAEVTRFDSSYRPQTSLTVIEKCFTAMEQLRHHPSSTDESQHSQEEGRGEGQDVREGVPEQEMAPCTQVFTPERMKKTISGDSSITFSKCTAENLEFTQVLGTAVDSTEASKGGNTANSEHRQCSMYDTMGMTEDEGADLQKIENDIVMQHDATLQSENKERIVEPSDAVTEVPSVRVEQTKIGINEGNDSGVAQEMQDRDSPIIQVPDNSNDKDSGMHKAAVDVAVHKDEVSGGREEWDEEMQVEEEKSEILSPGIGGDDSDSDNSSMVICDNNKQGDEYDVEDDEE